MEKDYKKLYEDSLARMQRAFNSNRCTIGFMNEIFPETKESKDEKVRKFLVKWVNEKMPVKPYDNDDFDKETVLAWIEKQGEHANFRDKIQVGDRVTRNKDGVLVNLSQLNRVAKKDEKQGEKKPGYCHHEVDLSDCSEDYTKGYYDGWNNCNQQHSQLKTEQKLDWSKEDERVCLL